MQRGGTDKSRLNSLLGDQTIYRATLKSRGQRVKSEEKIERKSEISECLAIITFFSFL